VAETRTLAAVLAADVFGFSRLAGADEDRTLVDSCPGELDYDRALAAAKRLDAAISDMMASARRTPLS
jgi:class 3 adenylate cyclase